MTRAAVRCLPRLSIAIALGLMLACAAGEQVPTISNVQSVAVVPITAGPSDASILVLSIGAVTNPDREEVTLQVSIRDAGDPSKGIALGKVSLYPVNAPGRFVLRLPLASLSTLRAPNRPAKVVIVARLMNASFDTSTQVVLGQIRAELQAAEK